MATTTTDHNGLLRFTTAGSVDDGKSTLIGRLLYDSKSIFEDQLEAVESASSQKGIDGTDLSLLTDGLKAEREQGITIDVAYRYFATPKRKFIIADTPGHIQYTRNMVTGASTADLAIILIDARHGLLEQTHRHSFIASLLGLRHVVVCVNKMDLVDYSEDRFNEIVAAYKDFSSRLDITDIKFIPISALHGDNVVDRSDKTPWYGGGTLLHHLETVHVGADRNLQDCRFPVQYVIRPQTDAHRDFRGYAGRIASGVWKPGDKVVALPSGKESTIDQILVGDEPLDKAFPPLSVTMTLTDDIDLSRGDMLVRANNQPESTQALDARICWLSESPLNPATRYVLRHTTRDVQAKITEVLYRIDINTLHRVEDDVTIGVNDMARVKIKTASPFLTDGYKDNRSTGSFILVDPSTHLTVAAGCGWFKFERFGPRAHSIEHAPQLELGIQVQMLDFRGLRKDAFNFHFHRLRVVWRTERTPTSRNVSNSQKPRSGEIRVLLDVARDDGQAHRFGLQNRHPESLQRGTKQQHVRSGVGLLHLLVRQLGFPFVVNAQGLEHGVIHGGWFAYDAEQHVHALNRLGVALQIFVGRQADVEQNGLGVVRQDRAGFEV